MDIRSQSKHQRAPWILYARGGLQQTGLLQRHHGHQKIQLRREATGADSQIPTAVAEWSGTEELHEHSGKSCAESAGEPAERAAH